MHYYGKLELLNLRFIAGLVSKSPCKVAQNGKMLGTKYNNGGIWLVWRYGETFVAAAGYNFEVR